MSRKNISKYLFHSNTIKIVSLIFIVWFLFIVPTFAAGSVTTSDSLTTIKQYLSDFIGICSRLWVILAILAGKLMTNDFVYGAFLHMDIYLWKIWNIMKNFANFGLIWLVLFSIVKSLTGKEALNPKKIIINTLLAGILIQASWFLMGAVIDISTIATTAVGGFPSAFLGSDAGLRTSINTGINTFKLQRIVVNTETNAITTITDTTNTSSSEDIRKNVMPTYNSVSGPFIFLGMWVFKYQNYRWFNNTTNTTLPTLTLSFALQFFMIFFFTIGLLLLVVANIMRIWLLRIFIIWAPLLILMQVFNPKSWWWSGALKIFSISNLIAIVFKPVIFVLGISLMLIVVVSIQKGITTSGAERENNINGVSLSMKGTSTSNLDIPGVTNISISQNDLLWPNVVESGKNFFSNLIMLLLTLFIMRWFVKLSLTIGWWPIEDVMKKLTKKVEDMAKTMPILPFKWGAISLWAMQSFGKQQSKELAKGFGMNTRGEFTDAEQRFEKFMTGKLWITQNWTTYDYDELQRLTNHDTFMSESIKIASKRSGGLTLGDSNWSTHLETWLKSTAGTKAMQWAWARNFNWISKDIKTTFENNNLYLKALHTLMGGDAALAPGGTKRTANFTYENLLNNRYHVPTK